MSNITRDGAKQAYFHFEDNYIGEPTKTFNYKGISYAINTDGQKNIHYVPWLDHAEEKDGIESHTIAMAFSGPHLILNTPFKEIYGIGPFRVEDADGEVLLQMDMVKGGSKGGYQAPYIFGANDETGDYAPASNVIDTGTMNTTLLLDAESAGKLYDLFDENEYRVYIPNKRDLYYSEKDIATLVLPKYYKQPSLG